MIRVVLLALLLTGCATPGRSPPAIPPVVTEAELRATIAVLASDAFEGRMAGTPGEERTVAYIAERFRAAGLVSKARGPRPYLDPVAVNRAPSPKPPPGAKPPALPPGQAHFIAEMDRRGPFTSHNVVGMLPGRRPDGRAVLLMAHWDHLGLCMPEGAPDRICNGAVDNASGIAAMIAVAEQVATLELDRDVWFVATTAEEWGLIGAYAFAARPPLPMTSIVAGFNLDMIAVAPRGAPVAIVAPQGSRLEPLVRAAAAAVGRTWDGDQGAQSFLQRQDGWALAQRGAPMIMAGGSFSDMNLLQRFLGTTYHRPNDELRPDSDLGGAVDDANLHVELVRRAASRDFSPVFGAVPNIGVGGPGPLANRANLGMGRYGRSSRRP